MNKKLISTILIIAMSAVGLSWAQDPAPTPDESVDIQVPDSYVERVKSQGAVLELSLREAIRLALSNNLDIAIENFNEDLNRELIVKTRGFFDPNLTISVGWRSSESPTTSQLDAGGGVSVRNFENFTFQSTLRQNVRGGGALEVDFGNNRSSTNSTFSFINPLYGSSFDVSFIQPLWKGFRRTSTRRQLELYNLDTQISDAQFKQRVAEIVQQVQNQYWEMVYAVENYETQRKSMELAIIQHRNNKKRVQIGVMAPIEITSSHAEVARRDQVLIQSEVQIINAQNSLKRLLAPEPNHSIWDLTLIPTDSPQLDEVTVTLDQAIQTAVQSRPELDSIEFQVEKNEIDRQFFRRDGKPAVNLRANFGSVGSSGEVFQTPAIDTDGDGIPDAFGQPIPNPNDPRFGAFGNAWNQVFGFDFINWGIAVDLQIPLKNRSNRADLATARIRDRQLQSRLKNQQQMIMVEVRNAYETIATRKKSLEAATLARELSEKQLEGENKRFEAGLSTNFEVLRFQRDLAENQVSELRAMIDYQLALIALEKATYTIIGENDITLARRDQ